jgi:hypothetical protein
MRGETFALGRVLLAHHATVRRPPGSRLSDGEVQRRLLSYGALCEQAGIAFLTKSVGPFLGELATWCGERGYPPLNALAVNATTRLPGDGYYDAEQCKLWPSDVRACLTYDGYPVTMPGSDDPRRR